LPPLSLHSFPTRRSSDLDIGGRFSVLTAVGLLPIAVAGINVDDLMKGAADAREAYSDADLTKNEAYQYAALRNILYRKGYTTELDRKSTRLNSSHVSISY